MEKVKIIEIDGNKMTSKEESHLYLKESLGHPEYYGNNLDALFDVLSSLDKAHEIHLINKDKLVKNLGKYGDSLIQVFIDGEEENDKLRFKIKEG